MVKRSWMVIGLVVAAGVLVEGSAWAGEPATRNSLQLGLGFRYGIEMNEGDFNPWGVGLGVAAGYTLPNAIYAGGAFDYFFGDSLEGPTSKLTANVWQLMAEGGYDLGLGENIVIRPKVGLGFGSTRQELCADGLGCSDDSQSDFALAPGATFMLITQRFGLSVDLRYALIFHETTNKALIFSAGVGF